MAFSKGRFATLLRTGMVNKERLTVKGTDSASVREFINGSMIYFIGASTDRQVISVPADLIVQDERDFFENQDVPSKLNSRLTHSPFKWKFNLSTPTLPDYGISSDYDASRQYVELQKCDKCNHYFQTDYFEHVKLPGFSGDIREFNHQNRRILDKISVKDAFVQCPKCKRPVDTHVDYRSWVCVNPETKYTAVGIHITPFAGPNIISPSGLISVACEYKSFSDFVNFGLGESFADATTGLLKEEIKKCFVDGHQDFHVPYSVMGLDLGGLSACTIGIPNGTGVDVIHTELIPLKNLETRVEELRRKYNVINSVIDAFPYTDTVLRIQLKDFNAYAAIFGGKMELYKIKEQDDDEETALSGMRVVEISRERMLDYTAASVRDGNVRFLNCNESKETIIIHLTDLKRGKVLDKNGEVIYKWRKSSKGEDHYFFSLLYLTAAALMAGFGTGFAPAQFNVPLVNSFTLDEDLDYDSELRR